MEPKPSDNSRQSSQHQKDFWLQILLPILLLSIAALGFLIYLILTRGNGTQSAATWSHIAVIWLILPALVGGILIFVLLLIISRGLRKFHAWLPPKFHQLGKTLNHLNTSTSKFAEKTTSPIIGIRAKVSGVRALFSLINRKNDQTTEEG